MKKLILFFCFTSSAAFADVAAFSSNHVLMKKADLKWVAAPGLPEGAVIALVAGDPMKAEEFTLRLKVPPNFKIAPHYHPTLEHLTILEGDFSVGMGEKFDEKILRKLDVGDFIQMQPETRHFAYSKDGVVLQLHGVGPWGITYVNPADDPRNERQE